MKWLPTFVNRIFFSDEPVLVSPPDLCQNGKNCQKKKCCKHVEGRIIIYVNDSFTNRDLFDEAHAVVSDMFLVPVFGFFNPTSGLVVDAFMDFLQRYTEFNGYKASELFNSIVKLTNTHKNLNEIVILAHGSGGILAEQFLRLMRELKYPNEFINKFKFVLVGSPVCNIEWTRDECGKLISYTGEYLHERTDALGNKKPHKAYYRSKPYCNLCCDEDHSKSVPFPYIESIYNSGDLIATAGVANTSRLCQDMIHVDGVKIEMTDTYGHYNYHLINDSNYKQLCGSYLARDYNTKYSGDSRLRL